MTPTPTTRRARTAGGALLTAVLFLSGCGQSSQPAASSTTASAGATSSEGQITVTDMAGRTVQLKAAATKVFGAGPPATTMLYTLDPAMMAGWNSPVSANQKPYLTKEAGDLPVLGRVTGGKDTFNPEVLNQNKVDLIVDAGDINDSYIKSSNDLQAKTGIPVIMLSTDPAKLPQAYEILGKVTGRADQAGKLASESKRLSDLVTTAAAKIPADKKASVYYAVGAKGLTTAQSGSINARVIDAIGAKNAAGARTDGRSGRNDVSAEQGLAWKPDWVLVSPDTPTDTIATNPTASSPLGSLNAFANGKYVVAPAQPFGWVDAPPAVNQLLGMVWLGKSIYPDLYDVELAKETVSFYKNFYHYDMSSEEAARILKTAHTPGH